MLCTKSAAILERRVEVIASGSILIIILSFIVLQANRRAALCRRVRRCWRQFLHLKQSTGPSGHERERLKLPDVPHPRCVGGRNAHCYGLPGCNLLLPSTQGEIAPHGSG